MKKLIFLLLFFPTILFAQTLVGRHKFKLVSANLNLERTNANFIRVAADCRAGTYNCGLQVWQIVGVRGKPNVYQILLIDGGNKYLTWNDGEPGASQLVLTLQPRYTFPKFKYQQFIFTINDKGSYFIQPASDAPGTNDYYLSSEVNAGSHYAVGLFKIGNENFTAVKHAWTFEAPITPLPVQNSTSVIVSPPPPAERPTISRTTTSTPVVAERSVNNLQVDIKTGADNLEMKPFQNNVEIRVVLRNRPDAILVNANNGQNWPNNSIKRVTVPLPINITIDDIKELHVHRDQKLGGTPTTTIFNIAEKDNWNVDKITTTAKIKVDGVLKTYRFADFISGNGSNTPLYRFVYEIGNLRSEGQVFKGFLSNVGTNTYVNPTPSATVRKPIIKIETLTGGDDLRGGNDNLNISIKLKTTPARTIAINNVNNRETWGNFTEKTVSRELNVPPFTFDDIDNIVIRHTGGGGIGADNWYLDKLKIKLTIDGETRVLVDQVGAPIHYFTGESRSKTFPILK